MEEWALCTGNLPWVGLYWKDLIRITDHSNMTSPVGYNLKPSLRKLAHL